MTNKNLNYYYTHIHTYTHTHIHTYTHTHIHTYTLSSLYSRFVKKNIWYVRSSIHILAMEAIFRAPFICIKTFNISMSSNPANWNVNILDNRVE
jgi:hypothetical protein